MGTSINIILYDENFHQVYQIDYYYEFIRWGLPSLLIDKMRTIINLSLYLWMRTIIKLDYFILELVDEDFHQQLLL